MVSECIYGKKTKNGLIKSCSRFSVDILPCVAAARLVLDDVQSTDNDSYNVCMISGKIMKYHV